MGLLDSVLGSLTHGGSAAGNPLLETILSLVNNPETGGLKGLLAKLQEGGLGNIADSWVSTGKNLPISADQVQDALGSAQLGPLAEKLGISQGEASEKVAEFLPGIVDKLTPNGQVPDLGALGDLLGSFTKRLG